MFIKVKRPKIRNIIQTMKLLAFNLYMFSFFYDVYTKKSLFSLFV